MAIRSGWSPWVALAVLASAQLMLVLDVTVVNVALPDIGAALHLDRAELPWVMTIYTMLFGGLMLLGGRIADLFGSLRMTLTGLVMFTGSSVLCALSQDGAMLLAGRALQGLSAALLSPAALGTVMTLFQGAGRGKALGVWSALAGAGSALLCSLRYRWPRQPGSSLARWTGISTSRALPWSLREPLRPSTA
jgi:MFS family permease